MSLAAQLTHQFTHLLAGGTIHPLDRQVSCTGISTCCQECLTPLGIGLTQLTVTLLELLGTGLEWRLAGLDQLVENALHLLLTGEKLLPVLVQFSRLLATQQHIFPLLDLDLELQVGLIDQLRSLQRPIDQLAIATNTG
ncbi:hypothetical protein D3C79_601030 [compost metagenome]